MNWLTNFVKPKLSALVNRREVPDNLWSNCPSCSNMIHHKDLNENLRVCNSCNYHFRMTAEKRIETLFEKKNFEEIKLDKTPDDPLSFYDKKKYKDRLKEYRKKTNLDDAFILGKGVIQDNIYAHMWFNIAASQGHEEGAESRDSIAKKMTSSEIAEAQKLARECVAKNYKGC